MKQFFTFILLLICSSSFAQEVHVESVRMWPAPDNTRLVFDLDTPVEHTIFKLVSPNRVVIDLQQTRMTGEIPQPLINDAIIKRIRTGKRPGGNLRFVLDLKHDVSTSSFLLTPNRNYGHRLVVDIHSRDAKESQNKQVPLVNKQNKEQKLRDVIIAIDAGHGGEDPGASGMRGTKEKDVVFKIARELEKLVKKETGMRPVMVRDGDYYVGLRKRINFARKHRADFFISIHADAFKDKNVKGSSVYALSSHGASSEAAKWLADRENSADLIGGVHLDYKDELLASVLLDLSQTGAIEASVGVGKKVIKGLSKLGKVHKKTVQQAGFAVLKSPDIPSILVETAFISNPDEERKLKSRKHQKALASAIMDGLRDYFEDNAPPDTLLAKREHIVTQGDTLSEVARKYGVSPASIKVTNQLSSNAMKVGQVIRIPSS